MKKILFTIAICLLAFNAKAQTKEPTQELTKEQMASRVEWFDRLTKQDLVGIASKRLQRTWDAYQTADAPKVYMTCYDPAADTITGYVYSKQETQDTFNNVLKSASYTCKAYELSKIAAFQK